MQCTALPVIEKALEQSKLYKTKTILFVKDVRESLIGA